MTDINMSVIPCARIFGSILLNARLPGPATGPLRHTPKLLDLPTVSRHVYVLAQVCMYVCVCMFSGRAMMKCPCEQSMWDGIRMVRVGGVVGFSEMTINGTTLQVITLEDMQIYGAPLTDAMFTNKPQVNVNEAYE